MTFFTYNHYREFVADSGRVVEAVIHSLRSSSSYISEKLFLLTKLSSKIRFHQAELILEFLERVLSPDQHHHNVFETSVNTLKSIFTFTKLLAAVRKSHPFLSTRCSANEAELTQMAVRLIETIQNPSELKFLMMDKNLDGESVLDLVTFQEKTEVFMLESVQSFITTLWEGPFEVERNFSSVSKNCAIFSSFLKEGTRVDLERHLRCKSLRAKPQIFLAFEVW